MITPLEMLGWIIGFFTVFMLGLIAGRHIVYGVMVPKMVDCWVRYIDCHNIHRRLKRKRRESHARDGMKWALRVRSAERDADYWYGQFYSLAGIFNQLFVTDAKVLVRKLSNRDEHEETLEPPKYAEHNPGE